MRYVPSQRRPPWRERAATFFRKAFAAAWRRPSFTGFGLLLAAMIVIPATKPYVVNDEPLERLFMDDTFAFIGKALGSAVVLSIVLDLLLALVLFFLFPVALNWLSGRTRERETTNRLLKWFFIGVPIGIPVLLIAGVVVLGVLRIVSVPDPHDLDFVHVNIARVEISPLIRNLGSYSLDRPNAHLSGGYLAVGDNVVWLGAFPAPRLFSSPIAPVSDIHLRGNKLLIVTGDDLIRVGDNETGELLAHLPLAQMRIGLITEPGGFATPLLLAGNDGAIGYVFELYGDVHYTELLKADEPVVGAAGCIDDTAVALADRVVLLRKGFKPRLLLQLPQGGAPITSVFARIIGQSNSPSCVWLIATKNAVFADQGGIATLLIAGLGGILSDDGDPASGPDDGNVHFYLTDNERNTAVQVSLTKSDQPGS